jgi:hypothetical protein
MIDRDTLEVSIGPAAPKDSGGPEENPAAIARWNRIGAQFEVETLVKLREAAIEQATAMAKWLLASLLAINAAGALAVLNSIDRLDAPVQPATAFVAGMLLPLLSATIIQYHNYASLRPLQELMGYYLTVVDDGERVQTFEQELHSKINKFRKWGYLAPLCGWSSGAAFVAGAYLLGIQLVT